MMIELPLWRFVILAVAFAIFFIIIGLLISKWVSQNGLIRNHKAGEILIDEETDTNEPNVYLKTTIPLNELIQKPYVIYIVKGVKHGPSN